MGCFISKPQENLTTDDERLPLPLPVGSMFSPNVSPLPRTVLISTPLVHHPSLGKGDSHHLVSLTSTTYGSLQDINFQEFPEGTYSAPLHESTEVKTASLKQDDDSRKYTLSPDSVINTWELMDGLDDCLLNNKAQPDVSDLADPVLTSETTWDLRYLSSLTRAKEVSSGYHADKEFSISKSGKRAHDDILLYFTSLRGVRKTYEDCRAVRMIFQGFSVHVDERDISMDSSYKKELQGKLKGKKLSLPRVFIRGEHIGGAEEIKQLNESGELAKLLEGLSVDDSFGASCKFCGEARFVPCPCCSGSRKVFDKESEIFRRCMDCNENGLIRCPGCCSN